MKKIYLLFQLLLVLFAIEVNAGSNDFVTTWDLSKTGSGDGQIYFGVTVTAAGPVSYSWAQLPSGITGSGIFISSSDEALITGLPVGGAIQLTIAPTNFRAIKMHQGVKNYDKTRLISVDNWGAVAWNSMASAFYGCVNLTIPATDVPNLGNVKSMNSVFRDCAALNGPSNIGTWTTTAAEDMSGMFRGATIFNQDIGNWDTQNVFDMSYMFRDAVAFNQDIGGWDTAKVTDMTEMFRSAAAFDQNLGTLTWKTDIVTSMSGMFRESAFNKDISAWNTENVTTMQVMFRDAPEFNQNLGAWALKANVNLGNMFTGSGLDCAHYSATLMGWANNVNTPTGLTLGATGRQYGTNAVTARSTLTTATGSGGKGWTIADAGSSETLCILSSFPVTLISFSAREAEGGAALRWETASEVGASHFEIERSSDARNFTKMGRVVALGNSSKLHNYTFSDDLSGYMTPIVYYRLRSVDFDETFSLSRVIALQRKKEILSLGVYPNPVQKNGKVMVDTDASRVQARLLDLLGRQTCLRATHLGNGKAEFDLVGVKSGLYIIRLDSVNGTTSAKLVVN